MLIFLFVLILFFTYFFVGTPSMLIVGGAYLLGVLITSFVTSKHGREVEMYSTLYIVGALYMLACFVYMRECEYDWLLAFDTYDYFIPRSRFYIERGNYNYIEIVPIIFKNFVFFSQNHVGYWVYSCLWGLLAINIDADYYLTLQNATLFLFPFVGVVLYKIFKVNGFDENLSFKCTILICLLSSVFFYSSQILRDIHILLLYLIAIYITFDKHFSLKNLVILFLVVLITSLFRIESGIFLALSIPLYLYVFFKNSKNILSYICILLGLIVFTIIILLNLESMQWIFETQQGAYDKKAEVSTGVLMILQRIPILGDFLSIIYNSLQPLPFWSRLTPPADSQLWNEAYNIMGFTRIPSAFFNLLVVIFVCRFLFRKKIFDKFSFALKWQILIGFVFLFLQSNVINQRRLLAYYCIFYLVFFIIYYSISKKERSTYLYLSIACFIGLQILGVIYFM